MSELLNQPQLEHAIDEILYGKHEQPYSKGDALLMLINTQKRLYAESVIGANQLIPKRGDVDRDIYVEVIHRVEGRNALRAEQRKRVNDEF